MSCHQLQSTTILLAQKLHLKEPFLCRFFDGNIGVRVENSSDVEVGTSSALCVLFLLKRCLQVLVKESGNRVSLFTSCFVPRNSIENFMQSPRIFVLFLFFSTMSEEFDK
mmetsp:Transcript_19047/g.26268  ORF Transcript_19047/g.26268 Transcript_19047/m.26268 type:complete len:110 (+) Transcript_19047:174-503(+)